MKITRIAALAAIILGTLVLAQAKDKKKMDKGTEMSGTTCYSACVKQDAGRAACDLNCTDKSGDVVFVDDQGKAMKITNPGMVKDKMGKVKVRGEMKGKDKMEVYDVIFQNAG